ncbi:hypothetical protein F4680DRAFT_367328 [Xylaria scruposa]|nr:hypothetical protein F4680DRAFT_367328 [Xylaria scruposa]
MTTPEVSHGRGGAGNINPDDTQYVDGSIVRQGEEGTHGDGAYSTGRGGEPCRHSSPYHLFPSSPYGFGAVSKADVLPTETGAANIADKDTPSATRADKDFVPAEAVRPSMEGDFHTGRGGAANVAHTPETQGQDGAPAAKPPNQGLADKLKHKIFSVFKK